MDIILKVQDDEDVTQVCWWRKNILPGYVLYSSERDASTEIPIYDHDMMQVICKDKSCFVVDVTGDQFGIEGWFFTKKDYVETHLWDIFPGPSSNEKHIITRLEKEEDRLPGLKNAVEQAIVSEETKWTNRKLAWSNLHELSGSDRETLLKELEAALNQQVKAYLDGQ